MLFWELTARCNLRCVHCRRLTEAAAEEELLTEEVQGVFESAASLGKPIIVFSGGEPLLREDWRELADAARRLDLPTALATNGTLIDPATAEQVAAAGFRRVAVSLDGADAATHDAFRGVESAFDRAIAGITELQHAGTAVQINATVAAHNVDQLPSLYALACSLRAVALHLFLLVPVGCGAEISRSHQLPPETCEQVLNWICDRQMSRHLELRATCAPQYCRVATQRGIKPQSRGCLAGGSVIFVSSAGEVFPCGYLPVSCGSVRRHSLADIWRGSNVFAKLRDFEQLKGKCGRCEFKTVCGGCRARAFAATGDYLEAEPACAYEPQKG